MTKEFSFDHLSSTEFEEFCRDLLSELKFTNINWKKGTGYSSSPSDDGRDIECEYLKKDLDGSTILEKWFVDAKHYKEGVPVNAITNTINWAKAENPDFVVLISSNFFSNSTKRWIEKYENNTKPSFKIKLWEKPTLQDMVLSKRNLLKKYKLTNLDFPFLDLMHPIHLRYIRNPSINSVDYFFSLMDAIDVEKRDKIFSSTYSLIVYPILKKSNNKNVTIGDFMGENYVDYNSFKNKVYDLINLIPDFFLIRSIINDALCYVFNIMDSSVENERIAELEKMNETFEQQLKSGKLSPKDYGFSGLSKSEMIKTDENIIEMNKKMIKDMPQKYVEFYGLYTYLCEEIISKLFEENILDIVKIDKLDEYFSDNK